MWHRNPPSDPAAENSLFRQVLPCVSRSSGAYHHLANPDWVSYLTTWEQQKLTAAGAAPSEIAARIAQLQQGGTDRQPIVGGVAGTIGIGLVLSLVMAGALRVRLTRTPRPRSRDSSARQPVRDTRVSGASASPWQPTPASPFSPVRTPCALPQARSPHRTARAAPSLVPVVQRLRQFRRIALQRRCC